MTTRMKEIYPPPLGGGDCEPRGGGGGGGVGPPASGVQVVLAKCAKKHWAMRPLHCPTSAAGPSGGWAGALGGGGGAATAGASGEGGGEGGSAPGARAGAPPPSGVSRCALAAALAHAPVARGAGGACPTPEAPPDSAASPAAPGAAVLPMLGAHATATPTGLGPPPIASTGSGPAVLAPAGTPPRPPSSTRLCRIACGGTGHKKAHCASGSGRPPCRGPVLGPSAPGAPPGGRSVLRRVPAAACMAGAPASPATLTRWRRSLARRR